MLHRVFQLEICLLAIAVFRFRKKLFLSSLLRSRKILKTVDAIAMVQPILKQKTDTRIQGLYLAQGRDVPIQVFYCRIAASERPSTNKSYWLRQGENYQSLNADFVNLNKQLPPSMAAFRLENDKVEGVYRAFELYEGDTVEQAVPVQQDNSGVIWELIFSL